MPECKTWTDLPDRFRRQYMKLSLRYRTSRIYARREDADREAFEEIRALWWNEQSKAQPKQQPRLF